MIINHLLNCNITLLDVNENINSAIFRKVRQHQTINFCYKRQMYKFLSAIIKYIVNMAIYYFKSVNDTGSARSTFADLIWSLETGLAKRQVQYSVALVTHTITFVSFFSQSMTCRKYTFKGWSSFYLNAPSKSLCTWLGFHSKNNVKNKTLTRVNNY